jgi:predicted transcriptional regulator
MYKLKEIAEILHVSDRTVRRYLNSYYSIENGAYQVSEKMLSVLKTEYLGQPSDNLRTGSDINVQEFERVEYFTEEEYQEFQKRLSEYPLLKDRAEGLLKDIEYYRKSMTSKERQMEMLLLAITNRKFIEE